MQDAIGTSQGQFDPRRGTDQSAFFVKAHVFRTILDADPLTGNVTPVLAADIPTQEDDKTWLLKLKPGIPFHDGSVLKASDVKYTVESINSKELNSLYNNVYNFIDSMDVVGAAPDIEQQHFPVGFDQCRYAEPVREIFRPARSHQRDLHPGVIGASRRHGLSHDHRHQRQRCCNPANH